MGLRYYIPFNIQPIAGFSRALLATSRGGRIVVDRRILALWQYANQRDLTEIVAGFCAAENSPLEIRAALACLAEAGLLQRKDDTRACADLPRVVGAPVSVILVTYHSVAWLPMCFDSLSTQTYSPLEIIVVDNASSDGSADWVAAHAPQAKLVRLFTRQSLAYAINRGIEIAQGDYFFILNPDVQLESDVIVRMIAVAKDEFACAAVAPKLRFSWAPAFLNGIGNHIGACSWAMDNGLGHLDLGQFDAWREVPSACFAAVLIPRVAWEKIGALDEAFPLYYEDIEWCYRARLIGYTIRTSPAAIVYHAFGARAPLANQRGMSPEKLQNVVLGRLRFAIKLPSPMTLARFLLAYGLEDGSGFGLALMRIDTRIIRAYWNAWRNFIAMLPALLRERDAIQAKRTKSDRALFDMQKGIPAPLIRNGLPELTWDWVQNHYLPLILSGKTRALPEFADVDIEQARREFVPQTRLARARAIWRNEGGWVLLHRIARYLQWRLAQV